MYMPRAPVILSPQRQRCLELGKCVEAILACTESAFNRSKASEMRRSCVPLEVDRVLAVLAWDDEGQRDWWCLMGQLERCLPALVEKAQELGLAPKMAPVTERVRALLAIKLAPPIPATTTPGKVEKANKPGGAKPAAAAPTAAAAAAAAKLGVAQQQRKVTAEGGAAAGKERRQGRKAEGSEGTPCTAPRTAVKQEAKGGRRGEPAAAAGGGGDAGGAAAAIAAAGAATAATVAAGSVPRGARIKGEPQSDAADRAGRVPAAVAASTGAPLVGLSALAAAAAADMAEDEFPEAADNDNDGDGEYADGEDDDGNDGDVPFDDTAGAGGGRRERKTWHSDLAERVQAVVALVVQ